MYLNPYLSTLKKDLQVNQVNYNSHAISSLLHCIAHMSILLTKVIKNRKTRYFIIHIIITIIYYSMYGRE